MKRPDDVARYVQLMLEALNDQIDDDGQMVSGAYLERIVTADSEADAMEALVRLAVDVGVPPPLVDHVLRSIDRVLESGEFVAGVIGDIDSL